MNAAAPDSRGFCPDRLARIRPAMQRYLDDGLYAGISTLVARHGSIVHQEQVGLADLETSTPMKADALFRVY